MLAETICSAVSAAGLGIAAITAYRRRLLAAARVAAYALVPLGLVLTGAVEWLAGTAFSPVAWTGFGLLGAAWLLFAGTRAAERRRVRRGARRERGAAGPERPDAVAPGAARPPLDAGKRRTGGSAPADDFSEIEAILKKHGI
ncbi:hypothetical protein RND61_30965 [Streptomyces sp. TRM76323]|uniref:Integral membrane protein n=1 Tax=Streptomyces tamarix TaxID=3078565 RepID=A0ABU3QUK6_9ACTN|nr:hypothetical protein [Streptomyces tamarix]MDT9686455.1 hypothetical protein [Streptomyces tamarix]